MRLDDPSYTPNRLLAHVHERIGTDTTRKMSDVLGVHQSIIARVETREMPLGARLMIAILDAIPDMTLSELRRLAGIKKKEMMR